MNRLPIIERMLYNHVAGAHFNGIIKGDNDAVCAAEVAAATEIAVAAAEEEAGSYFRAVYS